MGDNSVNSTLDQRSVALISVEIRNIVEVMNYVILAQSIGVLGIVANVINIIVFAKQGLQDAANISLLGLTIGDTGILITTFLMGTWLNPLLYNLDTIHFDPREIIYITAGWPRIFFTRVTSWITAFITFERCICIAMPLKVKNIFTPNRAVVVMVVIYVSMMVSISPIYYTTRLGWKFYPERNRSLIGLVFSKDRVEVDNIAMSINSVVLPTVSFVIVVICTIILAVKMRSKTKWREGATAATTKRDNHVSTRDMRVIRMVTLISVVFIISAFPCVALLLTDCVYPEFSVVGRYSSLYMMTFSVSAVVETINSSINIFIYMRMSTRYKATFDSLFGRGEKAKL